MSTIGTTTAYVPDTTAVVVTMPTVPVGETHVYDMLVVNTHASEMCYVNRILGDDEVTPYGVPPQEGPETFRMFLTSTDPAVALYAAATGSCVVSFKLVKTTR